MAYQRKWLQSTDVMLEGSTGALLVRGIASAAQGSFDLLELPLYHVEGLEDCTWDVQFALADLADAAFADPILAGDSSAGFAGLLYRVDYRGVPGQIVPVTAAGIATRLSEADGHHRSGLLLVPLDASLLARLVPGTKYIRRSRQKARGHDQWSVCHDQIILW